MESQETERNQVRTILPEYVREVLSVLCHVGFFERSALVGTWAMFLYRAIHHIFFALYTSDIDMAVQVKYPHKASRVDLEKVLHDLGAISDFSSDGLQRFLIPEFRIEFIAHNTNSREKEPGIVLVREWNINAQRLPFIRMLLDFSETVCTDDFYVRIPVPESFFVHKLIIANRRRDSHKRAKDLDQCRSLAGILSDEKLQQIVRSERFGSQTKRLIQRSCEQLDFPLERLGM